MAQVIVLTVTQTDAKTVMVEFPANYAEKFTRLSELRHQRSAIESEEKALKAELLDLLPATADRKGVKYVLKAADAIRASLSVRTRTNVSSSILKEMFPEAYEAASSEGMFDVINPA